MMQGWLFGHDAPRCDAGFAHMERSELGGGAWVDYQRDWVDGHARLFDQLRDTVEWREEDRKMYDRIVAVPRLFAVLDRPPPAASSVIEEMRLALSARYGVEFTRVSAALYRDGRDSVAWHGDYVARELPGNFLVATVSLGGPRKFLLRPMGGGRSRSWSLGLGDLIVMGGTCQRTHQHAVPKAAHAGPRIALMFRPSWFTT
jgi:alkylated DNA repair dioxygenase AlkB